MSDAGPGATAIGSGLPIEPLLPRISGIVQAEGSLVLAAEPGAGKTSLVPPALADALGGRILVAEPRRVAAVAAASRIAELRGWSLGGEAGYRVRGDSRTGPRCRVEALTPGVLVRVLQEDPGLEGV